MPNKLVGMRLSDEIVKKLENIGLHTNRTANQVAKNAIIDWVDIYYPLRMQNMIIVEKYLIKELLGTISIDKLKDLMPNIVESGVDFHFLVHDHPLNISSLDDFLKSLSRLFGRSGLMWFDHIETRRREKTIIFKGFHNLGEIWSRFYVYLLSYLMEKYFKLKIKEESIKCSGSSIILEVLLNE